MDLVIRNARIHTVDPARPQAEAVAVEAGRIAWVGDDRDAPTATEVVDAAGATVLPGFVDAHNHVRLGSDAAVAQLAGASTLDEVGRRIGAWSAGNPQAAWVEAEGLDYTALPGHAGTAADLDRLTDGRPAVVFGYDVHTLWLNTAALRRLGIDRDRTVLPFGVAAVADGEPTGFVHDFAVRGLSRDGIAALRALGLPWAAPDRQYARLLDSLDLAARCGITTVVEPQNSVDDLALFLRAREQGRLRSRLVAALFHPRGTTAADLAEFAELARTHDDDLFRVGPLKLYIDDVVEPRTAAMLEPYEGQPDNVGHTYYEPDEFADVVTGLDAAGFQLFVHATGDRGIRTVLDAVEQARQRNGPRDARHQIVHVECLDPADLHRFAELGVVACMQPRHCSPDIAGPGHDWADAVGEHRWGKAWPIRSLHGSGATLAFSSDWNVAEMDPLIGIHAAVTRQGLAGGPAWMPEQTVDLATAVRGYTWGSAFANFCEHDRDAAPVVDLTVLGGTAVHRR